MIAEIQNHRTMEMRTQEPEKTIRQKKQRDYNLHGRNGQRMECMRNYGPQDHSQSLTKPQHHKAAANTQAREKLRFMRK